VIVLFARWRGFFVTTTVGRRMAMWARRNRTDDLHRSTTDTTTVLLRIDPSEPAALPLRLIAGYLDRYGIRCDKVPSPAETPPETA
jgi:type VII secretion protein EccE